MTATADVKIKKIIKLLRVRAKPPVPRPKEKYIFRLFVAGATERSRHAIQRVRELCAVELAGRCHLVVVDIYQQPALARKNQIVATPTLVKKFPRPERRFIGSLNGMTGGLGEPAFLEKPEIVV